MNKQEKNYFLELSEKRRALADTLEDPAIKGIKNSVVEKYSDQAHFIYELLQNADDAYATDARFILQEKRLIFAHNGTRHFSISNPNDEKIDSAEKRLGDINAITSIGNSNKAEASIGKFGIGFKSVFQYTSTPHIYDSKFKFKIERFIVPDLLADDFPGRKPEETLFVFPFDHHERDAPEAYDDISNKLKNLSFPLLFLPNLKNIEFEFADVLGLYGKSVKESFSIDGTVAEYVTLTQNSGEEIYDKNLWLFSRIDDGHRYSVGFFLDENGYLSPVNEPAFCFFPTREDTRLNFILHAPFLLTDSREGIRAGKDHNEKMINLLAELAADAMEYLKEIGIKNSIPLINDDIVKIIPIDENSFSNPLNRNKVSFLPFYNAIKKKFQNTALLPSSDGYVSKRNAYWPSDRRLAQLFTNEQLADISGNKEAKWVFITYGYETIRSDKVLHRYIKDLAGVFLDDYAIINGKYRIPRKQLPVNFKGVTASFVERQEISWLHKFYKRLYDKKLFKKFFSQTPIFLNQNKKAVAAFDDNKQPILFLPMEKDEADVKKHSGEYTIVHPELLENKDSYNFIKNIGIKQPSLKDWIYNNILPQYDNGGDVDADSHFLKFFEYYCEYSKEEIEDLIELIKEYDFLTFNMDGEIFREKASEMYMPTTDLLRYFRSKPSTKFVRLEHYKSLVDFKREKQLFSFLTELGVKSFPSVYTKDESENNNKKFSESSIDGLQEIIDEVEKTKDAELSAFLWSQLCTMIRKNVLSSTVLKKTVETRRDRRHRFSSTDVDSSTKVALTSKLWLVNTEGVFVSAKDIFKSDLSPTYNMEIEGAQSLLTTLDITDGDNSNLTETQREKIEFADKLIEMGFDEENLDDFSEYLRQKEARKIAEEQKQISENVPQKSDGIAQAVDKEPIFDGDDEITLSSPQIKKKISKATENVIRDIAHKTTERESVSVYKFDIPGEEERDRDEYMPSVVDYNKKIERAKEKSAAEIDKITYLEHLYGKAKKAQKYSYRWFMTLLEMEIVSSKETNSNSRAVSISFAKVEREPNTKRTLVLKHPSRYIPQFMEDLADISLVLYMGDQAKKTVPIEVANIKSYTLRVKMKNSEDIEGIDLNTITSAQIDAQSPVFLLEELRKQFKELNYEPDFNMQENLCKNIEFVFGPPGTGKTTHLAKNVLLPIMRNSENCKVLVLTPTNKSADVLTRKIMEVSGQDKSYNDWLIRFGATGDEEIEQTPVFRDKTFDIMSLSKNVTVTTIARFPYDFFMPDNKRIYLRGINWDYIIIDEASMIPLVNIIYPLYKKTPKKFIIAGDPFQIEPITSINLWKNENIYTMVNLDSFEKPAMIPHQYKVELLTTQYRSLPVIGSVFSNFAYGGILKHYRSDESQRKLNLGDNLEIETLNIIKFPVSKYESIYRCKRLQNSSSYQVYSAIFTFEYVCYLSRVIAENNPGELFKIGVIAPYRAQADMIDKLLTPENLPREVDVQVGTIHGFQGDECDIIFVVLNTPPTISTSSEMFLNKMNIINVSISRARDYLFIVMPDDNTENIDNLHLVKKVENLIKDTSAWKEFLSPDLEELIFNDSQYLENNVFSTSHQSVNVYGLPEKIYEVRTEDTAIDIQIHRNAATVNSADILLKPNNSETFE